MASKIRIPILALIFFFAIFFRTQKFDQEGGDHRTYKTTVEEFVAGINPYIYTIQSYENPKLKHGYAYLPTLLYVQAFFYRVNQIFDLDKPTRYMWKIPVLLADIGLGILFIKTLYKKNYLALIFCLLFWFFNPHLIARKEYVLYEPLPIFFLFLSIIFLEKKSFLSGVSYAVAVSFKTFPIIFLPIFILKSKSKIKFLLAGILVAILISIPFMQTKNDFLIFIKGSLLVHGKREVQGRPFLTFISFLLKDAGLNFWQTTNPSLYAFFAMILPWLSGVLVYFVVKNKNMYVLTLLPIALYYIFTPVLSRTHLIWFLPIILIGSYHFLKPYKKTLFYGLNTLLYVFLAGYLYIWNKGIHVYNCSNDVMQIPTEKASTRQCDSIESFGFSHCPNDLGYCLLHCCIHEKLKN